MFGLNRRRRFIALAAILGAGGVISLGLRYFFPAPPTRVTIATAFKGASFDYFGLQYRDIFAREHIQLDLRETDGAVQNIKLLEDPQSGVQIAFAGGGISDGRRSPGVLSLGIVDHLPVWIFLSSNARIETLPELKGRRIAVGPSGSGTRYTAEKVLGRSGVTPETAEFLPLAGSRAAVALDNGEADAVWILGSPDAPAIKQLLRSPRAQLLNFPMADAFTRIFPNFVKLTLPRGVIDIEQNIPAADMTLIATTNRVLVRGDLHPAIVSLLLQTMTEVHSRPTIFQRAGEFPIASDGEYPMAASAVDFYKSGPTFLQKHLPLWLTIHVQRAIAALLTGVAIGVPLIRYVPMAYRWGMRRRLLYWYGQLKSLEASLDANPGQKNLADRQAELDAIEQAISRIRIPLALSNQLYDLRGHVDIVRRRLIHGVRATASGQPAATKLLEE